MTLLLDTHVFIWCAIAPDQLGERCRDAITRLSNELHVSSVTTLEIAQLSWAGRLEIRGKVMPWFDRAIRALGGEIIDIDGAIAAGAYELPQPLHRDPADRILAATARLFDAHLVTADKRLLDYPHINTVNARW